MSLPRPRTDSLDFGPLPGDGERFRRVRTLGSGSISRVDLVEDRRDGSLYAKKTISVVDEERLGVLRREFRIRSLLAHPQIPAPHLLGRDEREGVAWLLLDYAEGVDLAKAIRILGPRSIPLLLLQALNAVVWMHRRGVVHGDLKPQNLCIQGASADQPTLVRLLDFSTAVEWQAGEAESRGGTPAYMAPYVRETGRNDPRADLYALGRSFQEAWRASEASALPQPSSLEVVLQGFLERLVQADPDLAFPGAEAALEELLMLAEPPQALSLPRPTEARFVGRAAERALFSARRAALEAGLLRENLLSVRGPSGSGKTRLLQEFERECVLAGVSAFRIRCSRGSTGLAPLAELVARVLPPERPEHAELARALADEKSSPSQRLLRDLARSVKEAGAARPLVVLLDDLQEASETTLDFLRIFVRLSASSGPLFVSASSDEDGAPDPFEAGEAVETLRLHPLPPAELRELASSLLTEGELARAPVSDWVALSRGSAGLAAALAAAAEVTAAGRGRSQAELLGSILEHRLRGARLEEQRVLVALGLLARPVPLALLAKVSDLAQESVVRSLDVLLPAGLVEAEVHEGGRRFALASRLLEEPLCAPLSEEERRAFHVRALEAWSSWPFPSERPVEALVRHALGAGLYARAVELGSSAVRSLLARGSLRAAEELVGWVLPHADEPRVRTELQVLAAESKLRAGRPREAREALRAAESFARNDAPLELRLALAWVLGASAEAEADLDTALEVLSRASEIGRDALAVERQRLLERLGAVHYRRGDLPAARRCWEEGLALSEPDERTRMKSELLNDLGVLDWREGALEEALARHELALSIRRELGDLDGESRSLTNLANVAVRRGDFRAAAEYYEESLRLKRLVGSLSSQAVTLRNLGTLYRNRGDYGKAIGCLRESIELRLRGGDRLAAAATRRQLAQLLHEKGEVRSAFAELEMTRSELEATNAPASERAALREAEARFALEQGRFEDALDAVAAGLDDVGRSSATTLRSTFLRLRGRARLAQDDRAAARADLEAALAEAERTEDLWEIGWSRLWAGVIYGRTGERDRSRQEIQAAIDLARKSEMTPLLAEALLFEYDLAASEGQAPDAVRSLVEGERLAVRLGFPALELCAWHRMGVHALECGFVARAVQWWRKGIERLNGLVEEYAMELRTRILQKPENRELVVSLREILEGRPLELGASTSPRKERGGPSELSDLLVQAEGFAEPSGPGARATLRPEILTRLLEISRAVNSLHQREAILSYLRERLEELFGAENSQIILIGRDGSFRILGESPGKAVETAERSFSVTLLERVIDERRPLLIQDTSHDPELYDKKSVHRLGLVSVLCAPLIVDDEVLGIIQFDHRSRPGPFTEEDLAVLELFAHQAATALKNVLLLERLEESADKIRASEARLSAGERLRALGEMSAGVAHDFNNLLTIIVGITDLMLTNSELPAEMRRDLEMLDTVSKTAAATVRRLQAFRGPAPHRETRKHLDPAQVARQAAELGRRRFAGLERHELVLELLPVPSVLGQESELRDVLLNLLINAVEAMPEGGPITLRSRVAGGAVELEVEDRGVGVPREIRSSIFEPFFSTKPSGQGLGLWMARGIVQRMGGTIVCEPARERGTIFRLLLPSAPPEVASSPESSSAPQRPALSVLVVDDDPVVREIICRMLENAGFRPRSSRSGREALALFERETFDLVLTDYAMPEMDGAEVARAIKRLRADCPVVLLTGRSAVGLAPPLVGEAFNLILEKPITTEKLAAALSLSKN